MPIGSAIFGIANVSPNQLRTLVSTNVRYLNTPSSARLKTTEAISAGFALFPFCFIESTQSPNSQLAAIDAIMTNTNLGSPQA